MGDIFCARRATRSADLTAKKRLEKRGLVSLLLLCATLFLAGFLAGCQSAYLGGQSFSFGASLVSIDSALKTQAKKPIRIEQDRGAGSDSNREPSSQTSLQTSNNPEPQDAPPAAEPEIAGQGVDPDLKDTLESPTDGVDNDINADPHEENDETPKQDSPPEKTEGEDNKTPELNNPSEDIPDDVKDYIEDFLGVGPKPKFFENNE